MDPETIIAIENAHDSGQFNKKVPILTGKGAILFGQDGRAYVDCVGGHGVAVIGYGNPRITKTICEYLQSGRPISDGHFYDESRAGFMQRLVELMPKDSGLTRVFFCNSGTESVEAALKFAMKYKKHVKDKEIIGFKRAFHGRTLGALAITFEPRYRQDFVLIPGVKHASYNDIESVKALLNDNTICVILELIQGEQGVYPAEPQFVQALRELCTEKDVPLIFDEIQTGFGRTGKLFCFEHYGITPDILCLAKGIAAGIPMGATITTSKIMDAVDTGSHGTTFGGNPFACAVGIENLDIFRDEGLLENASKVSAYMFNTLDQLRQKYPAIKEIRGKGLMIGIQFKGKVADIVKKMQERGVLVLVAGMTVIRLLPPLVITMEQAKQVIDALDAVLAEMKE
ncbi:MAG: acetylornithine/succinylornithine family transaminase [Candidatus Lokiarchaeota archaeon]|nr:acetylornithine/succinylornithine family transaminase [Candidatus Lokiarchaeota archaeon]